MLEGSAVSERSGMAYRCMNSPLSLTVWYHTHTRRIHCFDNVAAVLFVAALSGYDCCLVEDKYSVSSVTF